jgi:hypothetical protein
MVTAMFLTGDLAPLPDRVNVWFEERWWRRYEREKLAAETVPVGEEKTTGVLLFGKGLDPGTPDLALTRGRWWRLGLRDSPTMLVVEQGDFVFEPHWCVYEVDDLQPRLVAAIPRSTARVIHDVVGDEAIVPRSPWDLGRGDPLRVEARPGLRRPLVLRDGGLGGASGGRRLAVKHGAGGWRKAGHVTSPSSSSCQRL